MVMFERPSNCCQFFLDIINCVDDHGCDDNATCTDENGSYVCVCDSGFTGDGFNCTGEIILNRCWWSRMIFFGVSWLSCNRWMYLLSQDHDWIKNLGHSDISSNWHGNELPLKNSF